MIADELFYPRFLRAVLFFLTATAAAHAADAGTTPLPWNVGDTVAGKWTVSSLERDEATVRLALSSDEIRSAVEIIGRRDDPRLPYKTRDYIVQPGMFPPPPTELLVALQNDLKQWERREGHVPFILGDRRKKSETRSAALILFLHAVLAVLLARMVAWKIKDDANLRRPAALAAALAAGLTVGMYAFTGARHIPTDWITVLHPGPSLTDITHLTGKGAHAGTNFARIAEQWASSPRLDLRDVLRMNIWLAGLNGIFFFLIARSVLGFLPAAGLTVLFATNPVIRTSALSEGPGQLLTFYLFCGALAACAFLRYESQDGKRAAWALSAILLLTLLCAMTRPESAGLGLMALAGAAYLLLFKDRDPLNVRTWSPAQKIGGCLALLILSLDIVEGPGIMWLADGARPLNPTIALLPLILWQYLPLGFAVLALFGLIHAFRHMGKFLGLPLGFVVLFRTYHDATIGVYCDMFRFSTLWMPSVFLFALFGWREIRAWTSKYFSSSAAAYALLALFLIPPAAAAQKFYWGGPSRRVAWDECPVLGHQQIETRFLVDALDRYPNKVFVARTVEGTGYSTTPKVRRWTFFGKPLPKTMSAEIGSKGPIPAALDAGFNAEDLIYFEGNDCHLKDSADCAKDIDDLRRVSLKVFDNPELCDQAQYGKHGKKIRLGLYRPAAE
jgi:hypothetical protein